MKVAQEHHDVKRENWRNAKMCVLIPKTSANMSKASTDNAQGILIQTYLARRRMPLSSEVVLRLKL